MNIAIQDMVDNPWKKREIPEQVAFWRRNLSRRGGNGLAEFNAWVRENGIPDDTEEALDGAEAYVKLPSNWDVETPEHLRLAQIDAFLAGYKFAKEESNDH